METKTKLTDESIESIQDLISVNIDSRDGFNEAAEHVEDANVSQLFREIAEERNQQVSELRTLVHLNDRESENAGSMAAAAHRAWMDLRATFGAGTKEMLDEAERGEDHIKAQYEEALKECAGSAVTDVLNRQYAVVKKAHDRVRDLRDSFAS